MSHASAPRSYIIESKGRSYCHNCQHICPLNPIITRPSPVEQPDSYTNSVITRPSPTEHQLDSHVNPTITRPSPAGRNQIPIQNQTFQDHQPLWNHFQT